MAAPARSGGRKTPELVSRHTPDRQFFAPIVEYIDGLAKAHPTRRVLVVVAELVPRHFYQSLSHGKRGTMLKALLWLRGVERIAVVSLSFRLGA